MKSFLDGGVTTEEVGGTPMGLDLPGRMTFDGWFKGSSRSTVRGSGLISVAFAFSFLSCSSMLRFELGVKPLEIFCDSQLVVYQVRGDYQAKGQILALYLARVQELLANLEYYDMSHANKIGKPIRWQNSRALAMHSKWDCSLLRPSMLRV